MADIKNKLDSLLISPAAKETSAIIGKFAESCDSVLEFGTRGGTSGLILLNALIAKQHKWKPRFVGVDLVADDTIKMLDNLANSNGISFQFVRTHTSQYPIHETDLLLWDTFHAGGSLLTDLKRLSPFVSKYIVILGYQSFGVHSEAIVNKLIISAVAAELGIDENGAKMGIKEGITKFLEFTHEWKIAKEFCEICILERKTKFTEGLFKA